MPRPGWRFVLVVAASVVVLAGVLGVRELKNVETPLRLFRLR
jgi:anti-sigma-K factor RskA